jgi:hypothetical protein
MLFELKVVTPQQFQQWIATQKKTSPSNGQPGPEPSSTGGTSGNGLGSSGGGQDVKTAIRSGAK